MEKEYKVQDFAELIGCDKKIIYDAVKRNELRTCEKRDSDTGRNNVTFIIADKRDIFEFKEIYLKRTRNKPVKNKNNEELLSKEPLEKEEIEPNSSNSQALDIINTLTNTLISRQQQVIEYAERAGQVKLLEDSESRTKKEYFKLVQDIAILTSKFNELENINNQLITENELLKKENETLKSPEKMQLRVQSYQPNKSFFQKLFNQEKSQ